jgi:hypothetical protein
MRRRAQMAKKSGGAAGKLVGAIATTLAVFLARKLVTAAWTRVTGKVPPTDPTDPSVSIGEALGWAAAAGITVEAARLFATRATVKRAPVEAEAELADAS